LPLYLFGFCLDGSGKGRPAILLFLIESINKVPFIWEEKGIQLRQEEKMSVMPGQYVLPSLIPDDEEDDFDAGKMLAQVRKRSSSTSQVSERNTALANAMRNKSFNVVPSMRVSSRSSRSGSYSSRPPSSFRAFKADSETTSNSSHPSQSSPSIRKRTSSLTLEAKTRANANSHYLHQQKALPSTPISATPSLTHSHSRTTSRSDEASSSSISRYSPEYRRHAIYDYTNGLDVLDDYEEYYEVGNRFESLPKSKSAPVAFHDDDSFITRSDNTQEEVSKAVKKKQVAFQTKNQRIPPPDKVSQLYGEGYSTRAAVTGQLNSQSTISLISESKANLKSLFSSITRAKGAKREDVDAVVDSRDGSWDTKKAQQETSATDYSSGRPRTSRKQNAKTKNKAFSNQGVVVDKGKGRETMSNELERPQIQQNVFYVQPEISSQTPGQKNSNIVEGRNRNDSDAEDRNKIQRSNEEENVYVPWSRPMKKSQSIDALYAMLQPCLLEQQERERKELEQHKRDERTKEQERRDLNESAPSPIIEWPSMRSEEPMTLAEIRQRTEDLAKRIEERAAAIERQAQIEQRPAPMVLKTSAAEKQPTPVTISAPLQHTNINADLLPPLTSYLDQCLALDCKEMMHIWQSERGTTRPLTASTPTSAIPKSWSGYIQAYAKGDFDLSNPPLPRYSNKKTPFSSPMASRGGLSPATPSMPGSNWSTSPTRNNMASKESLNDFYDLPSSYSSNNLLPLTPPAQQQSIRDRLPSPRFAAIRKDRSREQSQENKRLPHEDEDDKSMPIEELAALGIAGGMKGPRPVWEAERSASAKAYLHSHNHQANRQLQTIIERLRKQLKVSFASVQIVVEDESIVLASSGRKDTLQEDPDNAKILQRDETMDAHAILQRDGEPMVIADVTKDWRFENRRSIHLPFYAGASLFASDTGLPIGTLSVMHYRSKVLNDEERELLIETAREVERELRQMQRSALEEKLQNLDRNILDWIADIQTKPIQIKGASQPSSEAVLSGRLRSALQTILGDLQVEHAYIARVGSDPLQCVIQVQQVKGIEQMGKVQLDAALHLCALAAHKHGLNFDNDEMQVRKLIGEGEAIGMPFTSARVVACGLKEGGKAHRGTEGWVLGVASRSHGRLDAASGVYMMKFATLLAPMLLLGPDPRNPEWQQRRQDIPATSTSPLQTYVSAQSSPVNERISVGPRQSRRRRKIPLASPPPGTPLPLPPVMAASTALRQSTRKTIIRSSSRGNIKQGLEIPDSENMPVPIFKPSISTGSWEIAKSDDNNTHTSVPEIFSTVPADFSRGYQIRLEDLDISDDLVHTKHSSMASRNLLSDDALLINRPRRPRMMGGLRLDMT
jgi:GAF domain-containing protein